MASASADPQPAPVLVARGLSLAVHGLPLLEQAEFHLERGDLVVLVGPSGTGKTMLLKLIAGIVRPGRGGVTAHGTLSFDGIDLLAQRPPPGRVGILFQEYALFDQLTALENVRFARDHRRRGGEGMRPRALLEELGVRAAARPRTMSGGQLQRLALARTLALDPDLILYDEPTTGLDPASARRAAQLIESTHRRTGATSLVVTHDVATLVPIARRVLLLDPVTRRIEAVPAAEAQSRLLALAPPPVEAEHVLAPPRPLPVRVLAGTTDLVAHLGLALLHLLPWFPRWRHGLASLRRFLWLTASFGAFAYLGVAGIVLGYVATYFTFEHLPKRGFTEPLFLDDILRALGYLSWRVLCPVLVTILLAARTGAAIASDVGNRVYARQYDALRSFGVKPSRYDLTASLWALLLATPLLLAFSFLLTRLFSLALFIYGHPDQTYFFWDRNYHHLLRRPQEFLWRGTGWLLLKVELCAFGIGAIAWFHGAREKLAPGDVSRDVTRTIIFASLFVLLVHFALAFVEF